MTVREVGPDELDDALVADDHRVVIDFWGPWCAPCRALRPHLDSLSDEHPDWDFVAVNADDHPFVARRYDVMRTPTIVLVAGGAVVSRFDGPTTPSAIGAALADL